MLLIFLKRDKTSEFLYRAGDGGERLANLVGNRRGKTAECGHSILGVYFLLQTPEFREVLKIEDVTTGPLITGFELGNRNSQNPKFSIRGGEFNFRARDLAHVCLPLARHPKGRPQIQKNLAMNIGKFETGYFLSRAVQQQDAASEIGGE